MQPQRRGPGLQQSPWAPRAEQGHPKPLPTAPADPGPAALTLREYLGLEALAEDEVLQVVEGLAGC